MKKKYISSKFKNNAGFNITTSKKITHGYKALIIKMNPFREKIKEIYNAIFQ